MNVERTITPNPPADFNPGVHQYTAIKPFRAWCQKVLPLVYDDSLSYYELLCKLVDYLNKVLNDLNNMGEDIANLNQAFQQLQAYVNNYFSTLDVQEEINNKLDQMAEDGTLGSIITSYIVQNIFIDGDTPTVNNLLFTHANDIYPLFDEYVTAGLL